MRMPIILPAAAEFVKRIVPTAEVRHFDSGHFALVERRSSRRLPIGIKIVAPPHTLLERAATSR
jgi:hypothetical protein